MRIFEHTFPVLYIKYTFASANIDLETSYASAVEQNISEPNGNLVFNQIEPWKLFQT